MKPLTIEQLKELDVGDWVYIINKKYGFEIYRRKPMSDNDMYFIRCSGGFEELSYSYVDYGKKWIAYKNKECAEDDYRTNVIPETGFIRIQEHRDAWITVAICMNEQEAERRLAELKGEKI